MKTTSKRFAVAAALGLLSLAPAALAQTPAAGATDLPSIKVSYADLNMDSPSGMQTLTSRINGAVRRVCGDGVDSTRIRELAEIYDCRREARLGAWAQFQRNQERAQAARASQVAAVANRPEAH